MVLIKRHQNPPSGKKYQYYKPFLRIDFDYRCAYCKSREVVEGGSKKFHIDHYKPKSKFIKLINDYFNLFYSCSECNNAKNDFWPTILNRLLHQFILNPCEHDFDEHYNMNQAEWRGNTRVAIWNIERLRLNSKKRVQFRQDEFDVCEIIDELKRKQQELEKLLLKNKLPKKTEESFESDLNAFQKQIAILKRKTLEPLE
jgi:uncharacterized protein (TIGR02646 family)